MRQLGFVISFMCFGMVSYAQTIDDRSIDKKISVYPNPLPTGGVLTIDLSENSYTEVSIFDFLGSKVYDSNQDGFKKDQNKMELDLTQLTPGKYFIKITSNNEVITKKISIY